MKKIYWRPAGISSRGLFLIALISIGMIYFVETFKIKEKQPYYKEKIMAARLAGKAFDLLAREKTKKGILIDYSTDPTGSGLIGELVSSVTSNSGDLSAKQTTINPNFAAVIVQLLKKSGVKEGDVVACGVSGSFPAINISLYAAMQVLKLNPVIISSVSGSQWGANHPEFLWVDMERMLNDAGVFKYKSIAASYGGIDDKALGISRKGKELLLLAVKRNQLKLIETNTFKENINERMKIYNTYAEGSPVKVYINTGGGSISVGRNVGKKLFQPGLNKRLPQGSYSIDSVMVRFINEDIPVIHFVQIENLARKYGLPVEPKTMPIIGEGIIYSREEYNKILAGGMLLILFGLLFVFHNTDIAHKLLRNSNTKKNKGIEPMV